jgi:hypothetical protein
MMDPIVNKLRVLLLTRNSFATVEAASVPYDELDEVYGTCVG